MWPVFQSNRSWQSAVGMNQFSWGGLTPSWLYRARPSGMLISAVYLKIFALINRSDYWFFSLLPLSIDLLYESVWHPIPSKRFSSWLSKDRVIASVCGSVEDRHTGLVSINVIAITEGVHNVQLDVGEGIEGDVDQPDDLIHALQILTHAGDTLPVICHVFS